VAPAPWSIRPADHFAKNLIHSPDHTHSEGIP
jgi:hypothetical protein